MHSSGYIYLIERLTLNKHPPCRWMPKFTVYQHILHFMTIILNKRPPSNKHSLQRSKRQISPQGAYQLSNKVVTLGVAERNSNFLSTLHVLHI